MPILSNKARTAAKIADLEKDRDGLRAQVTRLDLELRTLRSTLENVQQISRDRSQRIRQYEAGEVGVAQMLAGRLMGLMAEQQQIMYQLHQMGLRPDQLPNLLSGMLYGRFPFPQSPVTQSPE